MPARLARTATILPLAIGLATAPVGDALRAGHEPLSQRLALDEGNLALKPACTLAFDAIKQVHPIDDSCGAAGSADDGTSQAKQNEAKNDFCASGTPVVVGFDTFDALQTAARAQHIPFGSPFKLPPNRGLLQSLVPVSSGGTVGEGTVVRLAAFVINAHYSNESKGESVNCDVSGKESNDIHIVLGQAADDDPCTSVTAEMSPHFRPDIWTDEILNGLSGRPLRFTGQLFFDASHQPCMSRTRRANPPRRSIFEIHPVYAVDVCNKQAPADPEDSAAWLKACDPNDENAWVSLQAWIGDESSSAEPD